jgi:hypothetical protein
MLPSGVARRLVVAQIRHSRARRVFRLNPSVLVFVVLVPAVLRLLALLRCLPLDVVDETDVVGHLGDDVRHARVRLGDVLTRAPVQLPPLAVLRFGGLTGIRDTLRRRDHRGGSTSTGGARLSRRESLARAAVSRMSRAVPSS